MLLTAQVFLFHLTIMSSNIIWHNLLHVAAPGLPWHLTFAPYQPSKLKFLLARHLATNSFVFLGRPKSSQIKIASSKILGAMATKMVATWRVAYFCLEKAAFTILYMYMYQY